MLEVRVAGRGVVRGGEKKQDGATKASCDLCGRERDAVASVAASGDTFACKDCLRQRLEAITVASWELREGDGGSGLPWGKVSG